ncbi:hypothetical protein A0257_06330 [Hymenobacter psoromatis]|nr:hypothetical protein A0257_06330 [Hymenobacter psoromatis]
MKLFLFAALLLNAPVAWAQTAPAAPPTTAPAPYRYCALVVDDRYFSIPDRLALDYGQGAPGALPDPEMAEMATNIRGSRSVIDALNYLTRHGWELVQVTTVPSETTGSGTDYRHYVSSETRYLLRRRSQ